MTVQQITKDEAIAALTAAAFTVTDPESSNHGRTLTHCFIGFLGADWDLTEAVDTIRRADDVAWVDNMFRHELAVLHEGCLYYFDVRRPAVAKVEVATRHPNAGEPFNPGTGPMEGYVVGYCGHRVARSEWRAGFRTCERCPRNEYGNEG